MVEIGEENIDYMLVVLICEPQNSGHINGVANYYRLSSLMRKGLTKLLLGPKYGNHSNEVAI